MFNVNSSVSPIQVSIPQNSVMPRYIKNSLQKCSGTQVLLDAEQKNIHDQEHHSPDSVNSLNSLNSSELKKFYNIKNSPSLVLKVENNNCDSLINQIDSEFQHHGKNDELLLNVKDIFDPPHEENSNASQQWHLLNRQNGMQKLLQYPYNNNQNDSDDDEDLHAYENKLSKASLNDIELPKKMKPDVYPSLRVQIQQRGWNMKGSLAQGKIEHQDSKKHQIVLPITNVSSPSDSLSMKKIDKNHIEYYQHHRNWQEPPFLRVQQKSLSVDSDSHKGDDDLENSVSQPSLGQGVLPSYAQNLQSQK